MLVFYKTMVWICSNHEVGSLFLREHPVRVERIRGLTCGIFPHVGVVYVVDVVHLAGADVQCRLPFVYACIPDRGNSDKCREYP